MKRYRLKIEDEAHVCDVVNIPMRGWQIILAILLLVLLGGGISAAIMAWTPLQSTLPGYMDRSERTEIISQMRRLDSLQHTTDINNAYVQNLLTVFNTDRDATADSVNGSNPVKAQTDTLITASEREKKFRAKMDESQRYSLTVLAPLASEGLIISNLSANAVFTSQSHESYQGRVAIPGGENITAVCDGRVIDIHSTPGHGFVIIMQHNGGFLSRISEIGTPLVNVGDEVMAGEAIASTSTGASAKPSVITIEMWRNGLPLFPYNILSKHI